MMTDLLRKTTQDFQQRFRGPPAVFSQAPGRINIIGEHTDYTGGLSLPAAIDCWTVCAWRSRSDNEIKIYSANMDDYWDTTWTALEAGIDKGWKKYVAGCFLLFKEQFLNDNAPAGVELVIYGNVPLGKGVSSSASVELAVLNGLAALFKKKLPAMEIAKMAQQVEHRYLNVKSGLLDQIACQLSKKQSALLVDFRSLEVLPAPLANSFASYSWILVDSLVTRELSNSKYSERVEEYNALLKAANDHGKNHLREIPLSDLGVVFNDVVENLFKRARHILSENDRTLKALECLQSGDVKQLGQLLFETHQSLSKDYEVGHKNLDFLVEMAKTLPGVAGGRMMGGGFGGCCLFLVESKYETDFCTKIADEYEMYSHLKTSPRPVEFVDGASAWTHGN